MQLTRKRNNGELRTYDINITHHESNDRNKNYYSLVVPSTHPDKHAGILTFRLTKYDGEKAAFLLDVFVPENEETKGKGNGAALLQAMEYVAGKHLAKYIIGKFYPHDTTKSKDEMINFYESHGYSVDETWEIYKRVSIVDIVKNIEPYIINYEIETISEHTQDGM